MAQPTLRPTLRPDPHPAGSLDALVRTMVQRRFLGEHADPDAALAASYAWAARTGPRARLLHVDVGDVPFGHAWLVTQGEDLAVVDLVLGESPEHPGLVDGVRDALLALAGEEGARRLTVGVAAGDATAQALVREAGFEVTAHQMRLDLTGAQPPEDELVLRPMTPGEFDVWVADEVESYAAARHRAGESAETALRVAREQHAELLPDGLGTPDQHFFSGTVGSTVVGTLWLGTERPMVFVYDVVVDPAHRRRGHGARMLRAAALWSQRRGSHALGLNVFGDNTGAKALYDALGFAVVETFAARAVHG